MSLSKLYCLSKHSKRFLIFLTIVLLWFLYKQDFMNAMTQVPNLYFFLDIFAYFDFMITLFFVCNDYFFNISSLSTSVAWIICFLTLSTSWYLVWIFCFNLCKIKTLEFNASRTKLVLYFLIFIILLYTGIIFISKL